MRGRKPNPNRPYYASVIAETRHKKGYTQEQLGKVIGITGATVKKYEGGNRIPSVIVLYRILAVTDNFHSVDLLECILQKPDGFALFVEPVISKIEQDMGIKIHSFRQKINIVMQLAEQEFLYWEDYKIKMDKFTKTVVHNALVKEEHIQDS